MVHVNMTIKLHSSAKVSSSAGVFNTMCDKHDQSSWTRGLPDYMRMSVGHAAANRTGSTTYDEFVVHNKDKVRQLKARSVVNKVDGFYAIN